MSEGPALRLADIRYRWRPGDGDVIDLEALRVERGEHLFLEGPSGCGKSTLLALLGGVVVPREGEVEILGKRVSSLGARARDRFRADHIGFIFQLFNLVPYLSLLENVVLPCRFSHARRARIAEGGESAQEQARRLLGALGLSEPGLYRRPVTELSIGQQQRAAAARALIGAPSLVIADEPTSALDEGTREQFLSLLFDECRRQSAAVVLVSHDPRLGELFDRQLSLPALNRAAASAPLEVPR